MSTNKQDLPTQDQIQSITAYGFGPLINFGDKTPCKVDASSFVSKLYAFLSYNKIPFNVNGAGEMSPRNQRCPWISIKLNNGKPDVVIEDSQGCIVALAKIYNIDMDSHLTAEQKIESETLRLVAENSLYQAYLRSLWVDRPEFFKSHILLPVPNFMLGFVVKMFRNYMIIPMLNSHSNGDMSTEESENLQATIFRRFADVLGKKKFMFSNDKPSLLDVYLTRFFDRVWEHPQYLAKPVVQVFEERPQLKEYGLRLQRTFFTEAEHTRIVDEGFRTNRDAQHSNTRKIIVAGTGVVVVVAVAGLWLLQKMF